MENMATDLWFTAATQLNDQFQDFQRLPATAAMPMFRQPFEQRFESRSSVRSREANIWPNSEWGYTDATNPCQGMKGFRESGRDRYVTDAEFLAVHGKADPTLQDAMDIALLTGQRPADVLKIQCADIRDGTLFVSQNKTGATRAIEIVGELASVIERIDGRKRERRSAFLLQTTTAGR